MKEISVDSIENAIVDFELNKLKSINVNRFELAIHIYEYLKISNKLCSFCNKLANHDGLICEYCYQKIKKNMVKKNEK